MKTSVNMKPELHQAIKAEAARRGIALQDAVDEALRLRQGQPPAADFEPDPRVRRAIAGVRALYASDHKLISLLEQMLTAAEVMPPPSPARKGRVRIVGVTAGLGMVRLLSGFQTGELCWLPKSLL